MKALLVGVGAGSRTIITKLLDARGHEPMVAVDGAHALAAIDRDSPALAVVEEPLEDMGAVEFCRRARASPNGVDLVILVIAAHDDDLASVLDAGATDLYVTSLGPPPSRPASSSQSASSRTTPASETGSAGSAASSSRA